MMEDWSEEQNGNTYPWAVRFLALFLFILTAYLSFFSIIALLIWFSQFYPGIDPEKASYFPFPLGFWNWQTLEIFYAFIMYLGLFSLSQYFLKRQIWALKWIRIGLGIDVFVFIGIAIGYRLNNYSPRLEDAFVENTILTLLEAGILVFLSHPWMINQLKRAKSLSKQD